MNFEMMLNPTVLASRCQSLLTQPGPVRQIVVTKLDEYKTRLLEELNAESQTFLDLAKLAVTEAEAMAWATPYPHLFLPALAEEKITCVRQWTRRQYRIATGQERVEMFGGHFSVESAAGEGTTVRHPHSAAHQI